MTFSTFRKTAMFVIGLALTINESVTHGPERPSLYVLWAAMMGYPLLSSALNKDDD